MKIGKMKIGSDSMYFVVEEGLANMGDLQKALQMIDAAVETGANAIEFQLAIAKDFYIRSHIGFDICLNREFSEEKMIQLANYAKKKNIDLIVAPFSSQVIDIMGKNGCSAFNVNASDINNPDILDAVAASGKPFFLSLLMSSEKEIEWAVQRISRRKSPQFGLLLGQHTMASGEHGVSPEMTNLGYIKTLKKEFNVPVGFIDHTAQSWMPSVAVAAGADVVTKHMALSRNDKGPDWHICLEPNEMKQAVDWARKTKISIEKSTKELAPGEEHDKLLMRRSIVSARQIKKRKIIEREDIMFKRPGIGIPPDQYMSLIGKTAIRVIENDQIINISDLE